MEIPVNVHAMRSRSLPSSRDKRVASEFRQRVWLERLIAAVASICLCLVILACVLRLWDADLTVLPLKNGDAIINAMSVKSLVDGGWWLRNPHLGMPFGQQLFDAPFADNLSMALMKLLSLFTRNYAVLMNIFFLLTFPITVITSLFVLRSFAISYPSALVVSLLYAFLPYHFLRGEAHLFLSAYYLVPVVAMICVWLWKDELDIVSQDANGSRISRRLAFVMLTVLLVGSGENYYAFFGCFLFCVAGAGGFFSSHRMRPLALAVGLSTLVALVVLLNSAPSLLYMWHHGANKVAAFRGPQESEIYGLKISQLLLPVGGHRLRYFRHLKDSYDSLAPQVNENGTATLGVVGGLGFLFLLASLLWQGQEGDGGLFRPLAALNAAAVFFGTIGGFGSLFNFVVYSQFRGYNRISVYIAFFSLFAVALLLEALKRRMELRHYGTWMWYGSLAAVLLIGILDQTTTAMVPNYEDSKAEDRNDAAFVKEIETAVPPRAMIFQLPIVPFPTNPPVVRMVDYDLLKGYLIRKR